MDCSICEKSMVRFKWQQNSKEAAHPIIWKRAGTKYHGVPRQREKIRFQFCSFFHHILFVCSNGKKLAHFSCSWLRLSMLWFQFLPTFQLFHKLVWMRFFVLSSQSSICWRKPCGVKMNWKTFRTLDGTSQCVSCMLYIESSHSALVQKIEKNRVRISILHRNWMNSIKYFLDSIILFSNHLNLYSQRTVWLVSHTEFPGGECACVCAAVKRQCNV